MRLTFPRMGQIDIPVKTLFTELGHEVVAPPPVTKRTFDLGVKYAPEFACLPFKMTLANYIEAIEKGAEAVVTFGGAGPCRFGYFAQVQRRILHDLGYDFELFLLDPPGAETRELLRGLRFLFRENLKAPGRIWQAFRLAWAKAVFLDRANQLYRRLLPRVAQKKAAEMEYRKSLRVMAGERDLSRLELVYTALAHNLENLARLETGRVLRVKIVGEIYMILESGVNFDTENILGQMGVEVIRSVSMTHWVEANLLKALFPGHRRRTGLLSTPHLTSFVGGHGRETIAETVDAGINRVDGVVQILPFTCMPELVAQSILPDLSRRFNLPVLSLVLDEHSGAAGVMTRLEAFVDLLREKREKDMAKAGVGGEARNPTGSG